MENIYGCICCRCLIIIYLQSIYNCIQEKVVQHIFLLNPEDVHFIIQVSMSTRENLFIIQFCKFKTREERRLAELPVLFCIIAVISHVNLWLIRTPVLLRWKYLALVELETTVNTQLCDVRIIYADLYLSHFHTSIIFNSSWIQIPFPPVSFDRMNHFFHSVVVKKNIWKVV